ncbi:MAG TPA: YSC84-related protein, partial [Vicinamibacterales bacterium]|nr:YSC84-related protein [Vicinamibacterales bacterium]
KITRASVGVGVQRGTGTLLKDGKAEGFYTTTGTSVGMQAGAKTYGYALFFMNDNAVQALSKAKGFEIGVGPTVVVVNKGTAKNLTTTTLKADIYAVIFDTKGLMAGLGVQGNKITKANPK